VADTYDNVNRLRPYQIWTGAVARAVKGDRITFAVVDVDPDQHVPEHQHSNEQVGLVLRGSITMVIDGDSRRLEVGDTYVIPGDVRHSASTGPEGATVIDVFTPVREDWESVERLQPSAGPWPG
jgi:quercetin dioxygenase-like cupin family protein